MATPGDSSPKMSEVPTSPASQSSPTWHALPIHQVISHLRVNPEIGLSEAEAQARLEEYGPNRPQVDHDEPLWKEFLEGLREPMVLLLLATGILYAMWGKPGEALAIFLIILALNSIELANERRAKRAIHGLQRLAEPTALVLRDGRQIDLPAEQLVPGDVLFLRAGRRVPADARLEEAYGLAVDESTLSGESAPVDKQAQIIPDPEAPLVDRTNMVFAGSLVMRGRARAIVVATGMSTRLGRLAFISSHIQVTRTPLQQAMAELSGWLVWIALGFSVIVPLLGATIAHQPIETMLLTGLSLAFATIPEEMPIIITMVLALGAYRLSRKQAIVRRLKSVETLGCVTVIVTDKTGTLTENRMRVTAIYPTMNLEVILQTGVLSSAASPDSRDLGADALEIALLYAAQEAGLDIAGLRESFPLLNEYSFDDRRKMMSTVRRYDNIFLVTAKGAPEVLLDHCTHHWVDGGIRELSPSDRSAYLASAAELAEDGLRLIAFAKKRTAQATSSQVQAETGLVFLGIVGLVDPPRAEARSAIAATRLAGIRPLMVTGDYPMTARHIARLVGLDGNAAMITGPEIDRLSDEALQAAVDQVSIFARATPEHKLRIVQALKAEGERVAVTGDGVNDAPALAAADIGVAMGLSGSDVARETADVVLADDNYATIANMVSEGRLLYDNLKKGVRYYLACKLALVLITLLPMLLRTPVPFTPIQIILMELFMDMAAAATFVVEGSEADLMRRPPRNPKAHFMDRPMVTSIFGSAVGLFAGVSTAYLATWYKGEGIAVGQTVAFTAWMIGHVLLALNLRSLRQPLYQLGLFSNHLMVFWGAASLAFVLLATTIPALQGVLHTTKLTASQWALVLGSMFVATFWIEIRKTLTFRYNQNSPLG